MRALRGQRTRACRRTGTRLTLRCPAPRLPRRAQPPRSRAAAPPWAAPGGAAPAPAACSTWESCRDGGAVAPPPPGGSASTADSARPAPPSPLAVRCRGRRRPLETPLPSAPCRGVVGVSGRCCSDLTRNPLWTRGFGCLRFFS